MGRRTPVKVLVTGASGFLGSAIARALLERGDQVVAFNRSDNPDLREKGAKVHRGDLADIDAVRAAVDGCDAVIHTAAKAGVWGRHGDFVSANIDGTNNVLSACAHAGVDRLVYTSTPSVIHGGGDVEGVDESASYPTHFETSYPATKAVAERAVLEANSERLATVALRPHLIWGPGDPHFVPRLVDRARRGRLALVGDGASLVDSVYIDNAADAHLLALDAVGPDAACAGKAYFVTNGEPIPTAELINRLLAAAGLGPVDRRIPVGLAWTVGAILELIFRAFRLSGEPPMTRFVARQLSTAHWYDIGAARRDLGYEPRISIDDGMERLTEHLARQQHG